MRAKMTTNSVRALTGYMVIDPSSPTDNNTCSRTRDSVKIGINKYDGVSSSSVSVLSDQSNLAIVKTGDEIKDQRQANAPVGNASSAPDFSSRWNRKRVYKFETNPTVRKRHKNRLLRKLQQIVSEYSIRVGQQAVVLVASPGTTYKVFGAEPLKNVVNNFRSMIMEELEHALSKQVTPEPPRNDSLFELPPITIDGFPIPIDVMTQCQLRAFIPLMLKYSTGRGKPGWGLESTRPEWWPMELPWANVRMDARSDEQKLTKSWTQALREIVISCYKYHGREDLLTFRGNVQTNINNNNTYYPTVLQAITNADGSIDFLHVDNHTITFEDETAIQGVATTSKSDDATGIKAQTEIVDIIPVTEAMLTHDGKLMLTREDGQLTSVLAVPVSASMYQSMITNIQQIYTSSDGTISITTIPQVKNEQ